ncbi:MAG TPA: hypothetical protein K8W01_20765 [Methylorubrum populi]|uniref:Uncharacterized protein n=1 Tax=Methylorubrum populi TaxID=223967 RepID=A0A921E606_9HYPH|nr:hypothetical protein [Methylorubrum populi]
MRLSSVFATALAVTLVAFPDRVPAATALEPFETVHGWAVERRVDGSGAPSCRMTHTAQDAAGETAGAVIVARGGRFLTLLLADRDWDFASGERLSVPLVLDGKPLGTNPVWTGDGQVLRAALPATYLPDLLAARSVSLRVAEADATFAIPDIAAAYIALERCESASAKPPAVAVEPALPSPARMASYTVGLAVERVLQDCDVAAQASDRAAVRARMATLRPEMIPYEAAIRHEITKSRGFSCPTADKEQAFQEAMRRFIAMSPDDLAAAIDIPSQPEVVTPVKKP